MVRQAQDGRDDSDFVIVLEELRSRIVVLFAAAPATLFCGVAGVVRLGQFERELEGTTYRPCLRENRVGALGRGEAMGTIPACAGSAWETSV